MPSSLQYRPGRNGPAGGKKELLFYRGRDLVITGRTVEVLRPIPLRYRAGDLDNPQVVRHKLDRTVLAARYAAVGALVVVVVSWQLLDSVEAWLLAALLIGTPLVIGRVCLLCRPRMRELRAICRGHGEVTLLVSDDTVAFNQACRALVRMLQYLAEESADRQLLDGRRTSGRFLPGERVLQERRGWSMSNRAA